MTKTILATIMILGALVTAGLSVDQAYADVFAKYDGIEGESQDSTHEKWIDLSNTSWTVQRPDKSSMTPVLTTSSHYEKSTVKLMESMFIGKVYPTLDIEYTRTLTCGATVTYLTYAFTNVSIIAMGESSDGDVPLVAASNAFESVKITYSEYNEDGSGPGGCGGKKGNVEADIILGK
ncbi:MAG TPA: type VI secretion system tube protein Hcp [Nitrosopumilaceae archaeon]|nr:type VI secretion system tube protein Hcp [Nitrosopumilaceae archaeon]